MNESESLAYWPERLLAVGQTELRGGHQPVRLDDPTRAWLVRSGRVELFLVSLDPAGREGSRHHLASIPTGSLLLGIGTPDTADFALLAVPHVDTELVAWTLDQLRAESTTADASTALCQAVEFWVHALSWGMSRWATPRPAIDLGIAAGETLPVAKGQRLGGRQDVAWLRVAATSGIFLDIMELPDATEFLDFPLAPESWLLVTQALEVSARTTAQAMQDGTVWAGVENLHQILFDTALLNLRLANVDEFNRLKARRQHNANERDFAFASLLAVTHDEPRLDAAFVPHAEPLLVAAMRLLGQEVGFTVELPVTEQATSSPRLQEIVRASRLRQRQISLRSGWWQHDFGALLAFDAETGEPRVLLHGTQGRPQVLHPATGEELPFAETRARLDAIAYEFTAPLPMRSLRFREALGSALQRSWRDIIMMALMSTLGGLILLATPLATAYLINTAIPNHEFAHLVEIGLLLGMLGGAAFVVSYVGMLAYSRAESRVGQTLQSGFMDRLLRLPMSFFQNYSSGDLAMRVMALTQVQRLLSIGAVQAILGAIFGLFSLLLMFYYDSRIALWAFVLSLFYLSFSLLIVYLRLRHERIVAHSVGRLAAILLQVILGIAKIRLAASEDRAFARWAGLFAYSRSHQLVSQRLAAWQSALNQVLLLVGLFLFILLIGKPSENPSMLAVGAFAALLVAFQQFATALTTMMNAATGLIAIQPQIERARPLLDAAPELSATKADPGSLSGAIEITRARFRYQPDGPLILDNVSLQAAPGEFIALVGASGSGKSTLLRLILGFETLESGGILFDGQEVSSLDAIAVRRQMGVVMQNAKLMPRSLYENIVGTSGGALEDAWDAAEKVGLADDIRAMPMGMQTIIMEGGGALSGGQMQRMMIARAIVNRPKILLLDEATSALDNQTQHIVSTNLDRLRVTRIVVAHRLSTIINADRIYVLEAGKVVEVGNYAALSAAKGPFARLAERQIA